MLRAKQVLKIKWKKQKDRSMSIPGSVPGLSYDAKWLPNIAVTCWYWTVLLWFYTAGAVSPTDDRDTKYLLSSYSTKQEAVYYSKYAPASSMSCYTAYICIRKRFTTIYLVYSNKTAAYFVRWSVYTVIRGTKRRRSGRRRSTSTLQQYRTPHK